MPLHLLLACYLVDVTDFPSLFYPVTKAAVFLEILVNLYKIICRHIPEISNTALWAVTAYYLVDVTDFPSFLYPVTKAAVFLEILVNLY